MFFTVFQPGQTKHLFRFFLSLSCLEGEGEVRGIQLIHATSPLGHLIQISIQICILLAKGC